MNSKVASNDIVRAIVSSEGNLPLAAERLASKIGERVTDYDLIDGLVTDSEAVKNIVEQFRGLLVVKLFDIIIQMQRQLTGDLDQLSTKDVARTFGTLLAAFATITAPTTKNPFDMNIEAMKAADELGLSKDEVLNDLKHLLAKSR